LGGGKESAEGSSTVAGKGRAVMGVAVGVHGSGAETGTGPKRVADGEFYDMLFIDSFNFF
jgi:hypothetical protein